MARAVEAKLQIITEMGATAIVDQTLIVVCGYTNTQSFQTVFMTTIFLIVAQLDGDLTHPNHRLPRPVSQSFLPRYLNLILGCEVLCFLLS